MNSNASDMSRGSVDPIAFIESEFGSNCDPTTVLRQTWVEAADLLGPLILEVRSLDFG